MNGLTNWPRSGHSARDWRADPDSSVVDRADEAKRPPHACGFIVRARSRDVAAPVWRESAVSWLARASCCPRSTRTPRSDNHGSPS